MNKQKIITNESYLIIYHVRYTEKFSKEINNYKEEATVDLLHDHLFVETSSFT